MIGKTLSHFKVLEEIGEGGMGAVYMAEDLNLGRKVALKILREEMASNPDRLERFRREAQAVAALNHRNIVTVFDVDQEDNVFFITMELLRGHPLNTVLKRKGKIGPRDVAKLGIQAAAEPDHFLDPVDDAQFSMLAPGHQQVKAVAAQVDSGISIWTAGFGHGRLSINVSVSIGKRAGNPARFIRFPLLSGGFEMWLTGT